MEEKRLGELMAKAKEAAIDAGQKILEIYHSDDFDVELKGDESPLTRADKAAHEIIQQALEGLDIPILSEEGREIPYAERSEWEYLWVVDPLDGTKEFIKRNGEFTVNIALVHEGTPILGVVYAPVLDKLYAAAEGLGASLKVGDEERVLSEKQALDLRKPGLRVVASRSHLNDDTQAFLDTLDQPEIVSMGSSLKFMMLAEGLADVYPRFAPTMEWDTAAAHAVLRVLAADVIDQNGSSLRYNKKDLLNPYFRAS